MNIYNPMGDHHIFVIGIALITFVVFLWSVVQIIRAKTRVKASEIGDGLAFYGGDGPAIRRRIVYIAGEIFAAFMIGAHYKKTYLEGYIPGDTFRFYGIVFLLFSILVIRNGVLNTFRLCENGFFWHGKKYDSEKCEYSFEDSKLTLYTIIGGEMAAVMPEYSKVLEVRIPWNKTEEAGSLLEKYYTKQMAWANETEQEKTKRVYISDVVLGVAICALAVIFICRGYIINEWELITAEDGLEITRYNGNPKEINIPMRIDGMDVVGIKDFGTSPFWKKSRVTKVYFPASIDRVSGDSLVGYGSLEEISLPSSVHILGDSAFGDCPLLKKVVIYGTGKSNDMVNLADTNIIPREMYLTDCNIMAGMFNDAQLESVEIKGNVKVEPGTFRNCKELRYVSLPEGIENIGDSTFSGCVSLQSVDLPGSVKTIGDFAFSECRSLQSVYLPEDVKIIGDFAFSGCGSLQSINLPESVETIGASAFSRCGSLQSIDLPEGVKTIEASAFIGCGSLQSIDLPESVKTIGDFAFKECGSLQKIYLPEGLESIGNQAFFKCESLWNIELPGSVKVIGDSAFSKSGLLGITIPGNVVCISDYAFNNCKSLQQVSMSDGLEMIGYAAFWGCESLQGIELPDSLVSLGAGAFKNCTALEVLRLPSSVSSIPKDCFAYCNSLKEIEIPEGCTEIDSFAFYDCEKVESVTLPDSLKTIEKYAFGLSQIDSVFLPDNLTEFNSTAFVKVQPSLPVYLCYTENCSAADRIKEACIPGSEYTYYVQCMVKNREEYAEMYTGCYVK